MVKLEGRGHYREFNRTGGCNIDQEVPATYDNVSTATISLCPALAGLGL